MKILRVLIIFPAVLLLLRSVHAVEGSMVDPVPERIVDMHRNLSLFLSDDAVMNLEEVRFVVEFNAQSPEILMERLIDRIVRTFSSIQKENIHIIAFMSLYASLLADDDNHVYPLAERIESLSRKRTAVSTELSIMSRQVVEFLNWQGYRHPDEFLPVDPAKERYKYLFAKYNLARAELIRIEEALQEEQRQFDYFIERRNIIIRTLDDCINLFNDN